MNENNGVMICPKCGNEMRAKDRFCFHCGYINYDNDNNQFLEKYDKKAQRILKKEKKKEPERSKFFNSNVKVNNTNNDSSGKKFYRSVEEYREDVNRNVTKSAAETRNVIISKITKLIVFIGFIVFVFYAYKFITSKQEIYIDHSNQIVEAIKKKYGSNNFKNCSVSDKYLFIFTSSSLKNNYGLDLYSPYLDSEYKGYVLVTRVGDSYEYKISLTDGTFGIREKNIDELKKLDVLPYYKVNNPMVDSECK